MKSLSASIPAILAAVLAAPSVLGQPPPSEGDAVTAPVPATGSAQKTSPDLEARLQAAQRRLQSAQRQLETAAREVAELSAERGGVFLRRYSTFFGSRAIIGVQIDDASGGAGARVVDVSPGGPAAEAGIRTGDVITAVNGTQVKGEDAARQVARLLRDLKPESSVRIEVSRDGKARQFTLTARRGPDFEFFGPGFAGPGMPPAPPAPAAPGAPVAPPAFAFGGGTMFLAQGPLAEMELATLTPRLGSYFGTDKGILVVRAPADGALKLEDGDVIVSIDGRVPASGPHATRILASYQPGEKIDLRIVRERKRMDIETTMPERAQRARDRVYFRNREFDGPRIERRVIVTHGGEAI